MASPIRLEGLTRRYAGGERPALDHLDLEVARGETVCLVGPSGCGKSTTLRLVAGLDQPDAGSIRIGERDVARVPPQDRDVAMVFQGFALYPHMRVRDILAFPLRMRRVPRLERDAQIARTAEMLGIAPLLDRRPGQLSGGEQQRVAMGRAIVRKPEVFLFDEPLSNLDAALRAELRVELARLLRDLGATALYVTHDQTEAMTIGQRIAVLNRGRLEQVDTPRRIYEEPATLFVAAFFGSPPMNLIRCGPEHAVCKELGVGAPEGAANSDELVLGVRPEHVHVVPANAPASRSCGGTVISVEPHGAESHVELDVAGVALRTRVPGFAALAPGATVDVSVETARVRWFARDTGRAL